MTRLFFSLILPPLLWLLFGWPSLDRTGNLALLLVMLAHVYVVIWQAPLLRQMRGDDFTYGAVALGLNTLSLLATLVTTGAMFLIYGGNIVQIGDVPKPVWGVIGLSLLFTLVLPLLEGRHADPLPKASDRRTYEDPTNGS